MICVHVILRLPKSGNFVKIETDNDCISFTCSWSDGQEMHSGLGERRRLLAHPETGEVFWRDECDVVGTTRKSKLREKYRDVPHAKEPTLEDYRRLLNEPGNIDKPGNLDEPKRKQGWCFWKRRERHSVYPQTGVIAQDKRRYLLIHYWWCANDPMRYELPSTKSSTVRPDDLPEKLRELRSLLNVSDPGHCLMMVEICRQLGEFDQAKELLNRPFPAGYSDRVQKFQAWCDAGDTALQIVKDSGWLAQLELIKNLRSGSEESEDELHLPPFLRKHRKRSQDDK